MYSKNILIELAFIVSIGKDTFDKCCIFTTILEYLKKPKYIIQQI